MGVWIFEFIFQLLLSNKRGSEWSCGWSISSGDISTNKNYYLVEVSPWFVCHSTGRACVTSRDFLGPQNKSRTKIPPGNHPFSVYLWMEKDRRRSYKLLWASLMQELSSTLAPGLTSFFGNMSFSLARRRDRYGFLRILLACISAKKNHDPMRSHLLEWFAGRWHIYGMILSEHSGREMFSSKLHFSRQLRRKVFSAMCSKGHQNSCGVLCMWSQG